MMRMQNTTRLVAFLGLMLVLVSCSTPTVVSPPTPDVQAIQTEAAKTVVAQITIDAALQPTATTAATATIPEPIVVTATPEPATPTVPPAATATLIPTTRPVTSGGVVYPTATRRAGPDQAQLISQDPKDGTVFSAGYEFDGVWVFKNVGTSTWTTGYEYRYASGAELAMSNSYALSESVEPGDSISLVADMKTPTEAGRYVTYWQLVNENGDVFYEFYLVVDVQ